MIFGFSFSSHRLSLSAGSVVGVVGLFVPREVILSLWSFPYALAIVRGSVVVIPSISTV